MTAFGEHPVEPVGFQIGVVTPSTPAPTRSWCPNTDRPSWLPPREFHCGQDHYLQGKYGITCDDYWRQHEQQGGVCGICRRPPKPGTRLVVDHDHDSGDIDGLCHFGCNRRLTSRDRRYLKDPPGGRSGLRVGAAQLRKIRAADQAKRDLAAKRRPVPVESSTSGFHERTQAALAATRHERS